jgi:hypothetical protein
MKSSNLSERRLDKSYFKRRKERCETGVAALDSRDWLESSVTGDGLGNGCWVTRAIAGVELERENFVQFLVPNRFGEIL